jgi:signal transduction histidine kinase
MINRRLWILWAALAYAVIIAVTSGGLYRLYNGSRDRLDEAMGQRLLAAATSLSHTLDSQLLLQSSFADSTGLAYLDDLQQVLTDVRTDGHLAEVTLTDVLLDVVLISTSEQMEKGKPNDYWDLDYEALELVKSGQPAATALYQVGGVFQKSAHAPIYSYSEGVKELLVVVTVTGSPDFFDSLGRLKQAAIFTGLFVVLVLVVMGFLLYRINVMLARYRASILRQENLAAMGRMTAGIAHEIRNPLSIIRASGQHLQRVLDDAEIKDEIAPFIVEEVDRLDHILKGYLAFGTESESELEVFDLGVCVRRSASLMYDELATAGIKTEGTESLPAAAVLGDPRRLQQVLLNLLMNARDAMSQGGTIHLSLALTDGSRQEAILKVIDEGSGLAGVSRDKLFEPFWTSKEKGSGLGLVMSRNIVEDMGGRLDLNDRTNGSGVEAVMTLPITTADRAKERS